MLPERASALLLGGVLAGVGTLHLVHPQPFEELVPRPLGDPRLWVYASGVAELVGAALVAHPRTRRVGGWFVAGLLVAVFPGNIKAALDGGMPSAPPPFDSSVVAWVRLPLQVPLVLWALRHARGGATAPDTVGSRSGTWLLPP
ncbi:MAG: hypothetical protein ABIS47_08830 [Acidimicrobiales bacterium]